MALHFELQRRQRASRKKLSQAFNMMREAAPQQPVAMPVASELQLAAEGGVSDEEQTILESSQGCNEQEENEGSGGGEPRSAVDLSLLLLLSLSAALSVQPQYLPIACMYLLACAVGVGVFVCECGIGCAFVFGCVV